jgi:hypothetical protein
VTRCPSYVGEIWKPIKDWEELYEVSNFGRVKSLERTIYTKSPWGELAFRTYRERILKETGSKYPTVSFTYPGKKRKCFNVHSLVLETFVGPRPQNLEACHTDNNPKNNKLDNLRYDTRSANALDRRRHKTASTRAL